MLKLKRREVTPPNGFGYVEPDTDFPIHANCFSELVTKVRSHRMANKLPDQPDLELRIEDWICRRLPPGICVEDVPGLSIPRNGRVATSSIVNDTIRSWKATLACDESEANNRGAICAKCERNIKTGECSSCRGVNSIIKGMVGTAHTNFDSKLNVCDFCGMLCRVIVHCRRVMLPARVDLQQKPKACWLAQGG